MNRRQSLGILVGAGLLASRAYARSGPGMRRMVVYIGIRPDTDVDRVRERWRALMTKLGFRVGTDVELSIVAVPLNATDPATWERSAREVILTRPDVVCVYGQAVARMFKRLTNDIPTVFVGADDPVGAGLVESLRRPGGNMTGFSGIGVALHAKRLELLKELQPRLRKVANLESTSYREENEAVGPILAAASRRLAVEVQPVLLPDYSTSQAIMAAVRRAGAEALLWGVLEVDRATFLQLLERLRQSRMPHVLSDHRSAEAGCLMALGESEEDRHATEPAAELAARILRGESPADIPVVQIAKVHLTVNLGTARAMGINLPSSILARADRVIS